MWKRGCVLEYYHSLMQLKYFLLLLLLDIAIMLGIRLKALPYTVYITRTTWHINSRGERDDIKKKKRLKINNVGKSNWDRYLNLFNEFHTWYSCYIKYISSISPLNLFHPKYPVFQNHPPPYRMFMYMMYYSMNVTFPYIYFCTTRITSGGWLFMLLWHT